MQQESSYRLSSVLKIRNPMMAPGETIIESDTHRSKTNKDESKYIRFNDAPYNDAVLSFETVDDLKSEHSPYRRDQLLFVKNINRILFHDEGDTISEEDRDLVIVDETGRRLKRTGLPTPPIWTGTEVEYNLIVIPAEDNTIYFIHD
jgi:hypothetical protein